MPSHNKAWTLTGVWYCNNNPDSKVHGANMGPIWGRQDPGGPLVGPMNLTIREWAGDIIKKWPGIYRSISFTKGINVELWCWWSFVLSQRFQILLNSLRETHECILVSGNNKHTGKTITKGRSSISTKLSANIDVEISYMKIWNWQCWLWFWMRQTFQCSCHGYVTGTPQL